MKQNQTLSQLAQQKRQQQQSQGQGQPSQGPKENAEINAKIDAFAAANPKLVDYYKNLPRERLERVALKNRMEEAERKQAYQERQVDKLKEWVSDRPDVAAMIDKLLKNVPSEKQTGAFVNIARREQQKIGAATPPNQTVGGP